MSKIIFLMVFTLAIINLKAQIALPVAATGNVLKDGTTQRTMPRLPLHQPQGLNWRLMELYFIMVPV